MHNYRYAIVAFSILASISSTSAQDSLVVTSNLGTLGPGTTNITGDTSTGANNADFYVGATNQAHNWGNELVFAFAVTEPTVPSLRSHSITGDPDFFLLNGLSTAPHASKRAAQDVLGAAFLDFSPPQTSDLGAVLTPGTYYISIDSYIGADGATTPADATFDVDLVLSPLIPPNAVALGVLGDESTPFNHRFLRVEL